MEFSNAYMLFFDIQIVGMFFVAMVSTVRRHVVVFSFLEFENYLFPEVLNCCVVSYSIYVIIWCILCALCADWIPHSPFCIMACVVSLFDCFVL